MKSLSEYIQDSNLEDQVYNLIASCLSEDEPIEKDWLPKEASKRNMKHCDFYLEKGCAAIGWDGLTLVEVKLNLMPDTVMRAKSQFDAYTSLGSNVRKILVYSNHQSIYPLTDVSSIRCISIADLQNICEGAQHHEIVERASENDNTDQDTIKARAKSDFHNAKISLFLGAGVSMDAKLPSWSALLERLLIQKGQKPFEYVNEANASSITKACGDSSIITGRYVHNGYEKDEDFADRIHIALYEKKEHSNLIDAICEAIKTRKVSQVITYNYDDLIEQGLNEDEYYPVFCKNRQVDNRMPIFHVHGMLSEDKSNVSYPILSEKDYHNLYKEPHNSSNVVQLYALNNSVCYFIGFSMTDPNLRRLLDFSRSDESKFVVDESVVPHYVFMRKVKLEGEASSVVNEEHWLQQEEMMRELGLNIIWYDEFKDLPKLIREMIK